MSTSPQQLRSEAHRGERFQQAEVLSALKNRSVSAGIIQAVAATCRCRRTTGATRRTRPPVRQPLRPATNPGDLTRAGGPGYATTGSRIRLWVFSSFRRNRTTARRFWCDCTRMSRTSPSSSPARHIYCWRPWILTNTSSRCRSGEQVTVPVPRDGSIIDLRWPLANRDKARDLSSRIHLGVTARSLAGGTAHVHPPPVGHKDSPSRHSAKPSSFASSLALPGVSPCRCFRTSRTSIRTCYVDRRCQQAPRGTL